MTQRNLSISSSRLTGHREQIHDCQKGEGLGKNALGVWDKQMQTITYMYN